MVSEERHSHSGSVVGDCDLAEVEHQVGEDHNQATRGLLHKRSILLTRMQMRNRTWAITLSYVHSTLKRHGVFSLAPPKTNVGGLSYARNGHVKPTFRLGGGDANYLRVTSVAAL